jgi:hypothetical protein
MMRLGHAGGAMEEPPDWRIMSERIYEVRVAGLVPTRDLLQEFGDAEVVEHEVRTVVTGRFPDQAALHGFLHRLRAYGLEVVEVRRVQSAEQAEPPGQPGQPGAEPIPEEAP